jgi:hypothetical protein
MPNTVFTCIAGMRKSVRIFADCRIVLSLPCFGKETSTKDRQTRKDEETIHNSPQRENRFPAISRLALCSVLIVFGSCPWLTRTERGIGGFAQRSRYRPERSDCSGSVGCRPEPRHRRATIRRNQPCGTLPVSRGHAGRLFHHRQSQRLSRCSGSGAGAGRKHHLARYQAASGSQRGHGQSIGSAPLLRPEESSASTVLERSLIEELPLNGRKYTDFATLTPNTSYDGDTGLVSIAGQQGGEDSGYANGNGSTAFTVDGSTPPATISPTLSAATAFRICMARTRSRSSRSR